MDSYLNQYLIFIVGYPLSIIIAYNIIIYLKGGKNQLIRFCPPTILVVMSYYYALITKYLDAIFITLIQDFHKLCPGYGLLLV